MDTVEEHMTTLPVESADLRPRRQILDRIFRWSTLAAGAVIVVILVLIAWTITGKSLPVFRSEGFGFFTERRWAPADEVYGALSFIFGTAVTALSAVIIEAFRQPGAEEEVPHPVREDAGRLPTNAGL